MKKCAIYINICDDNLKDYEILSLNRIIDLYCNNDNYDLLFHLPNTIDFNKLLNKYLDNNIKTKCYNDNYKNVLCYKDNELLFESVNAYNNMLSLNQNFYGNFVNYYNYMLTYQLDGYIFDNQLEYFLNKKYDYIGGYYLPVYANLIKYNEYENINTEHHLIMNSGVSLKKLSFCIESIQQNYKNFIKGIEFNNIHAYINDDDFFSMFYTTEVNTLDSIRFSLNYSGAETHYAINNFQYPFCCHAFHKSRFLQKLIENYNKEHNLDYYKYIK